MSYKIAILGNAPTQHLAKYLKKNIGNYRLEISDFDIDQIDFQILNKDSELYHFKPHFIIIFYSSQHLYKEFCKLSDTERRCFASEKEQYITQLYNTIQGQLSCKVIWNNFYEINDGVFGNFSNKLPYSFLSQLRELNYRITNLSYKLGNLFIYDLSLLQNQLGTKQFIDERMSVLNSMAISMEATKLVAKELVRIINSINGILNKCLILDLDNTIWGGVIGDDGLENIQVGNLGIGKAFSAVQVWAKELKNRGIILAVCSKNDEKNAKEPFEKHPDMELKLDDIAIFVANWNNKVDNIRHIQKVLNISFNSMVFIDDNPFERNLVSENIEDICVPNLPEDPAEYASFLRNLNLFETASVSEADKNRTEQYQAEAKRIEIKKTFVDEANFLQSLNMKCKFEEATLFSIPRIAQLTQRSNQFNLRTQRYSEKEIEVFQKSDTHKVFSFALNDNFGSYGIVSVIILELREKIAFIDTWIMSCRVLKRGLEQFVLNKLVIFALDFGYDKIVGEYLPTNKNKMVKNLYPNLGFSEKEQFFELDIYNTKPSKCYILDA